MASARGILNIQSLNELTSRSSLLSGEAKEKCFLDSNRGHFVCSREDHQYIRTSECHLLALTGGAGSGTLKGGHTGHTDHK